MIFEEDLLTTPMTIVTVDEQEIVVWHSQQR
jgi:hypothetical protein